MQVITIVGMALCFTVLYYRIRKTRSGPRSGTKRRFKTLHLLLGAILVWLVISMHLRHLTNTLGGEPQAPASTWDRVIETLDGLF